MTLLLRFIAALVLLGISQCVLCLTPAELAERGEFSKAYSMMPHDQGKATLNVFFGRPDLNLDLSGLPTASAACPDESDREISGREWVIENSRDRKVLMFNENHYGMRERIFLRKLLPELRNIGFSHIGFEALLHNAENVEGRYSPASDLYTREPLFAALLREAESLGFNVFGYEPELSDLENLSPHKRFELREEGQAKHIKHQLDAAAEGDRFVIFAGWSHIAKKPVPAPGGPGLWMAGRLKEQTGIDPLVVDLTSCVDVGDGPIDWNGRILLDESDLPIGFGRDAHAFDAELRLPASSHASEKASGFYRQTLGYPVSIPDDLLSMDQSVLIEARAVTHTLNEAAFDRILLHPGERHPIYLPPGHFRVIARSGSGEIIGSQDISVDSDGHD